MTFKQFMQRYQPLVVEEIPNETATEWIAQCEKILHMIGIEE